ncbi:hypothetical protein HBI56_121870 [Parastagonospora nodorum]|nr:hypothetical protein HBH53_100550 [Parastagonospora nodorum]KAH3970123.1 hypothetical protein HBH51_118630 [Parastagonospora nodorum]KAH4037277.1 hypothetical protein HBI09_068340 [Parastagonospora nodorum]KAH4107937.1 hypothetical protein HBH46_051940 [Parastagonospora nodorum]KAH4119658.1 hypothetical protein HBH47_121580 [Parastagonospora nodorum]
MERVIVAVSHDYNASDTLLHRQVSVIVHAARPFRSEYPIRPTIPIQHLMFS